MSEYTYDDLEITNVEYRKNGMVITWKSSMGFGCVGILKDTKQGIIIDHEYLSKEFCQALMHKLIEKYYQ